MQLRQTLSSFYDSRALQSYNVDTVQEQADPRGSISFEDINLEWNKEELTNKSSVDYNFIVVQVPFDHETSDNGVSTRFLTCLAYIFSILRLKNIIIYSSYEA